MSKRILDLWCAEKPVVHTPADDLESYVWVHLLNAIRHRALPTATENNVLIGMEDDNVPTVANIKGKFRSLTQKKKVKEHPFYGLIGEWLVILGSKDDDDYEKPMTGMEFLPMYKKMLQCGFAWLEKHHNQMRRSWDDFFALYPSPFI